MIVLADVTQGGEGRFVRTACECLAASMALVISHGSARVRMAGQAASVTKVMPSIGFQTSEACVYILITIS